VGVPILIFVVGFGVGSAVLARWLPDLGGGRVAGVAFLVVCGLVGMVFALVALHVYEIVRQLDSASSLGVGNAKPDVIANGLLAMLRDIGPILGLAAAVYLLAPAPDQDESPRGVAGGR
jgi:hypothetical protein